MASVAPMALTAPVCMLLNLATNATCLLPYVYQPDIGGNRPNSAAGMGGWPEGVCTGTTPGVPGACRCIESI